MAQLLNGKVALVTAGTSGLGTAFCRALAAHGAAVGIHYRSDEAAARALEADIHAGGGRAVIARADLREPEQVQSMAKAVRAALGPLDVLVNNASIYLGPTPVESLAWEDMQAEFEGSVKTAFLCTQAALPEMLERGRGTILMLVGTMVHRPASGYAAHTAGKGALLAYARTLAKEVGPRGVAVHMISPGMALTPNVLDTLPEAEREKVRRKTPKRRLPTPEALAGLAVLLASDLAISATALHLDADGGLATLGG